MASHGMMETLHRVMTKRKSLKMSQESSQNKINRDTSSMITGESDNDTDIDSTKLNSDPCDFLCIIARACLHNIHRLEHHTYAVAFSTVVRHCGLWFVAKYYIPQHIPLHPIYLPGS